MQNENSISKYLSLLLRHQPEKIGLQLDSNGWASVPELIRKWDGPFPIDQQILESVVANNTKNRFSFDEAGLKIRANQGHSIEVDLKLEPAEPPELLYHGTIEAFMENILQNGLQKMDRLHVHLSRDKETAKSVGSRRGKPVILVIQARRMFAEGFSFYLSDNGVWLTNEVTTNYITIL